LKKKSVEATIYSKDLLDIKYAVCHLTQTYYEDDTFEYVFKPYYQVIDVYLALIWSLEKKLI